LRVAAKLCRMRSARRALRAAGTAATSSRRGRVAAGLFVPYDRILRQQRKQGSALPGWPLMGVRSEGGEERRGTGGTGVLVA
jgi:hypothetical protein